MDGSGPDGTRVTVGRLSLRPWRAADAVHVRAACDDPEVLRWLTLPSPSRPEDARAFVEEVSPQAWRDGSGALFAVLDIPVRHAGEQRDAWVAGLLPGDPAERALR